MNRRKSAKQEEKSRGSESQLRLVWRRFRRNKLALAGGTLLVLVYLIILPAEFFAPYGLDERHGLNYAPPQRLRFYCPEEGRFHLRPFVYPLKREMDTRTFQVTYIEDRSRKLFVQFFIRGSAYRWGPIVSDLHLFGFEGGKAFLLGTDRQGRDTLSRILIGGRVTLTVSMAAVILSLAIGSTLGVISGYLGGTIDSLVQRVAETIMSFPEIPLWMGLAAAVPAEWDSIKVYFMVTLILAVIRWAPLCRQIRGRVLVLREEEFTMAARAIGASTGRLLFRHYIPLVSTYIIVMGTLSIPHMILIESTLSFLGLGIRPPMTSWGVLLQDAQMIVVLARHPWLLTPAAFVIVTILCFNLVGEGLRDAADPYSI